MSPKARKLYAVVSQVRTCFNRLKALAEEMHRDLGVNPSMRAVMESLATDGKQTVPEIAHAKGVSRQHIQVIMNALQDETFVQDLDNPAHKSSPVYSLTDKGRATFALIWQRDEEAVERLAAGIPMTSLEAASKLLATLNQKLTDEGPKRAKHDNSG